jgi:hypothetical protein
MGAVVCQQLERQSMEGTRQTRNAERGAGSEWAEGLFDELRKGREAINRSRALLARLDALLEDSSAYLPFGQGGRGGGGVRNG